MNSRLEIMRPVSIVERPPTATLKQERHETPRPPHILLIGFPQSRSKVRFLDMAACGRRNESEKSNTIPVHQRITIRMREPLSRASALPVDRLTLQATTSGSTHSAHAPQKISA